MSSLVRAFLRPLYALGGLALVLMVVIILAQVVLRYAFADSFIWGEEMARFMMIAAALIGAVIAHAYGSHIRFELLEHVLPKHVHHAMTIVGEMISLSIALGLLYAGYELAEFNADQQSLTTGISMLYIYSLIPVTMALFTCVSIKRLFDIFCGRSGAPEQSHGDLL